MKNFYTYMLTEDKEPNEALRLAKLDMIKKGIDYEKWGAFIIMSQ